jgi:septum formation protein
MRGRSVSFINGRCLLNSASSRCQTATVIYNVSFRDYSDVEIERYLDRDRPFDCAGSFKSEGYGITLIDSMEGADPTALIGLPLIELARMLRQEGVPLP